MPITFDHLVLLVHDLDAATQDFEALGFTVLERADTEHGSTRFRFVSFADGSYILLTAFAGEEARAGHRLGDVLDAGDGWADYSFVVPDATATGAALNAGGHPTRGPVRVSNVLAGDEAWGLDLLMTGRGAGGSVALPFVLSDVEGRAHRIPGPSGHANGATGIKSLSVSADDPATVIDALAGIGGDVDASRVTFGGVWVDVLALADAAEGRPGGGMVEVVLTTSAAQPEGGQLLDRIRSHGAPIRLVGA